MKDRLQLAPSARPISHIFGVIVFGRGGGELLAGERMFHTTLGGLRAQGSRDDDVEEEEAGEEDGGDKNNGSALVKRDPNWVPSEVIVIPVFRRPVFPGIATPIALTNPAFCEAILKLKDNSGTYPLVGIFMTKQPTREEGSPITNTDELHQIGCLGQVVYIHGVQQLGVQLLVAGAGRILITGTARTEPFLSVTIQKVHDKPVDPMDKNIKAWVLEIISTMKSVVKLEHSFKEQLQTALTQVDVNNPGLLADITASMTTADRDSLQTVSHSALAHSPPHPCHHNLNPKLSCKPNTCHNPPSPPRQNAPFSSGIHFFLARANDNSACRSSTLSTCRTASRSR